MKRPSAAALVNLARLRSRFLRFDIRADVGMGGGDSLEIIVGNKTRSQVLGRIKYYVPWEQHIFAPERNTVWSIECLADIGKTLEILK